MDWERWIDELEAGLESGDHQATRRWMERFAEAVEEDDERVPTESAEKMLGALQDHALFPLLRTLGELVSRRNQEVRLRRRLAQARIETGEVTRAIGELKDLERELGATADDGELTEVVGLLGRGYKKLFLDASPIREVPREEDYRKAVEYYRRAWEDLGGGYWPGVNLVALEAFHERVIRGRDYTENPTLQERAATLLDALAGEGGAWALATRAELLLAQGRNGEARKALQAYLEHAETTLFMVQSTRRQFRELWGLTAEAAPGDKMLPMLEAACGEKGGVLQIEETLRVGADLEAILGDTGFQPLAWLRTALDRARSVVRIGRKPTLRNTSQGTGFLVAGEAIHPRLAGKSLVLTNAHVATSLKAVREALRNSLDVLPIEETRVAFLEAGGASGSIRVVKEWFSSPPDEFDATLLELESAPPDGVAPAPLAAEEPVVEERVNILGHPNVGDMMVSLQDNRVTKVASPKVFYRTPTEAGSSGSPVFDHEWNLLGLHHAGPAFSDSDANEGLLIGEVFRAIRAQVDAV